MNRTQKYVQGITVNLPKLTYTLKHHNLLLIINTCCDLGELEF
jgi:hypothetical protein